MLNNQHLQRADAPGEGWPPIQAVDLLVELQAEEAIPAMLVELKRLSWETILFNKLVFGLKAFGDRAFDPVMSAYRELKGQEIERSLLEILAELGRKDETLFQLFLSQLETEAELGAMNLASYGDRRALDPLYKTFDQFEVPSDKDPSMADQVLIELREAIESLGGQLTQDQVGKFEQVLDRRKRLGRQMQAYAALSQPQRPTPIKKGISWDETPHAGVAAVRNTRNVISMRIVFL